MSGTILRSLQDGFFTKRVLLFILIGLTIRFVLGFLLTYGYDCSSWAVTISNIQAGFGLYDMAGYNYAPPWGYVLAAISMLTNIAGVSSFGTIPLDALEMDYMFGSLFGIARSTPFSPIATDLAFNMLFKTFLFAIDVVTGYLVFWIVRYYTDDVRKAEFAFGAWMLCISTIVVVAVGGMFDSLSLLLMLMSFVFLIKDRYVLSGTVLGLAVLLKLFPAFVIFVFIVYVLMKCRGSVREFVRPAAAYALGLVLAFVIVMWPNFLDGNIEACFAFITSRATSGTGAGLGDLEKYGSILIYTAVLVLELIVARDMYRNGTFSERCLLTYFMMAVAVIFVSPSTPQYIILLIGVMIIFATVNDRREFMHPFLILMVGATMFFLTTGPTNLLSLATYTDWLSIGQVVDWSMAMMVGSYDLSLSNILYFGGGVLQYAGVILMGWYLLRFRFEKSDSSGGKVNLD